MQNSVISSDSQMSLPWGCGRMHAGYKRKATCLVDQASFTSQPLGDLIRLSFLPDYCKVRINNVDNVNRIIDVYCLTVLLSKVCEEIPDKVLMVLLFRRPGEPSYLLPMAMKSTQFSWTNDLMTRRATKEAHW